MLIHLQNIFLNMIADMRANRINNLKKTVLLRSITLYLHCLSIMDVSIIKFMIIDMY